jgi:uncharacterized repeat protein (TIGR02059 family)
MLQAGDEGIVSTNNNLDGEIITGNKFIWNGTDITSITHGVFTGHNKDVIIEYNYLNKVPMGIIRKSSNDMTNISGGIAYNIVISPAVAVVVKGMSNVNIYNNTFYQTRTCAETGRGLIDVYTNTDVSPASFAHGTKIKNNIFYTKYQTSNIRILDNDCFTGFECDYNLYWCEAGTPQFEVNGSITSFAQWQALGYDTHSVVVNPNFINFSNFIPTARLDYGTNLSATWQTGLSTTAAWTLGVPPATTNQNGTWQVGAHIFNAVTSDPVYIRSVVENATPTIIDITYNLSLANIVPSASAFSVLVNSAARTVNKVTVSGTMVQITLSSAIKYGDIVKVSYTKPSNNLLQNVSGGHAESISAQPVVNNCINIGPTVSITSPANGDSYTAPAIITIIVNASDVVGTLSKMEFYNGNTKLGEKTSAPYSFTWDNVAEGTYFLTAIAIDNLNTVFTSTSIEVHVNSSNEISTEFINLFPNPNEGHFKIEINNPLQNGSNKIAIVNFAGEKVYECILLREEVTKQLDLSYMDSGIYILMIIGKDILIAKKFIKN